VCCLGHNQKSCVEAGVDTSLLKSGKDLNLEGVTLSFSNRIPPNGYVYKSRAGDQAVITLDDKTGDKFGTFKTIKGKAFALEKCSSGHVWIEYNVRSFKTDVKDGIQIKQGKRGRSGSRRIRNGLNDNTTMATFSVMFYYTPKFKKSTPNIEGYFNQIIAEANQGFANSGVPMRATKFCTELTTFDEDSRGYNKDILGKFSMMKVAALFIKSGIHCGAAYGNTLWTGRTVSWTTKDCGLGHFTFGHEIGHSFGLQHDPASTSRGPYHPLGHGHLIEKGKAPYGYATIMGYTNRQHPEYANYYSDPNKILPQTGTPTGKRGISNNVAVLLRNRFVVEAIGDESGTCPQNK